MAKQFYLIPVRTYTFTIDTNLSKQVATHLLRHTPLIRNISCRITSETPAGLRGMYFPNTEDGVEELQEGIAAVIERALDPVDEISRPKVTFDSHTGARSGRQPRPGRMRPWRTGQRAME